MNKYDPCPCGSKQLYHKCCKPYHDGSPAENAQVLMRSRYSAYALGLADYVINTTHPANPSYCSDFEEWRWQLREYCKETKFKGLEILNFVDGEEEASVKFVANLAQLDNQDATFTEESKFVKENGQWFYKSGETKEGRP